MKDTVNRKRIFKVNVDGEETTFTRQDVKDYFRKEHGMGGMRSFGPVSGDWRMIDAIAEDARDYFGMNDEEEIWQP
jgi:hypothetical protein